MPRGIHMRLDKYKKMTQQRNRILKIGNKNFLGKHHSEETKRKKGVRLQADHIKMFFRYPELRFELSNGQTLCKKCNGEKGATHIDYRKPKA